MNADAETNAPAGSPDFAEAGETQAPSCITVEGERGWIGRLNCLNLHLQRDVSAQKRAQEVQMLGVNAEKDASPTAIGLFNQYSVQERLGAAYGKSAMPQRPPTPVYSSPLVK